MRLNSFLTIFLLSFFLQSCEFNCSVGKKEPKGVAEEKNGTKLYNHIKLDAYKISVKRAYLVFEDGGRVPDDNFVDFSQPIKLMLDIDSGWVARDGRVFLGASEKILTDDGTVLLDEPDLFKTATEGVKASDAKSMYLKATLHLKPNAAPTTFSVQFRVWDKNGDGYFEGSYMLNSK